MLNTRTGAEYEVADCEAFAKAFAADPDMVLLLNPPVPAAADAAEADEAEAEADAEDTVLDEQPAPKRRRRSPE